MSPGVARPIAAAKAPRRIARSRSPSSSPWISPATNEIPGADPVDDLHHIARRIAKLAAGQQKRAGFGIGRPRQRDERHAVACRDRRGKRLSRLGEAQNLLCIALGEDQKMQMRRRHFEQLARFQGGRQGRSIIQIVGHRLSGRGSERCELQDQRPATRAEHRGDPGQVQPRARLNERIPRRVLESRVPRPPNACGHR